MGECIEKVDKNKDKPLINLGRVCSAIADNYKLGICYNSIAIWRTEISFCHNAYNTYKASCATQYADPNKNLPLKELIAVCDSIKDSDQKEYCYADIAIYRHSREICEQIREGSPSRNTCMEKT